jgi:hypothetical protein
VSLVSLVDLKLWPEGDGVRREARERVAVLEASEHVSYRKPRVAPRFHPPFVCRRTRNVRVARLKDSQDIVAAGSLPGDLREALAVVGRVVAVGEDGVPGRVVAS